MSSSTFKTLRMPFEIDDSKQISDFRVSELYGIPSRFTIGLCCLKLVTFMSLHMEGIVLRLIFHDCSHCDGPRDIGKQCEEK